VRFVFGNIDARRATCEIAIKTGALIRVAFAEGWTFVARTAGTGSKATLAAWTLGFGTLAHALQADLFAAAFHILTTICKGNTTVTTELG